jgi:hypothetical protein
MLKIKLTDDLKGHQAVIVRGDEVPDGYIEIAGAFFPNGEISIAVPKKLTNQIEIINVLAKEAQKCLMGAMRDRGERI